MTAGGTMTAPLLFTTNTRIGMDDAAYGGVPNMFMRSDGGAFVFHADGWNEYTIASSARGINFKVHGNPGADEYWGVTGGPLGNGAALKVYSLSGGWPCIGSILASNEGQLMLGNDTGTVLNIQGPTGELSLNYFRVKSAGLGDPPALSAVGTDTDIGIVVAPKGGGAIQATIGGNARGAYARDWQTNRALATQIASGNYSVIGGGNSNSAIGVGTVVGGGLINNADGNYSVIPGGFRAWARGQHGWFGWASSLMQGSVEGEAQGSWRLLAGISTGGAAVRLTSDTLAINAVAPNINSVWLGNDRAHAMSVKLVGIDATATSTHVNAYFNDVLVGKDLGGAFNIYLGTPRTLGVDLPTVAITVGAENLLSIVVTPANANTWHFLAKLSCAETM
jgi:hypothetical protein